MLAPGLPASGMSKKPAITVRFHTETNGSDGDSFAMPVKLLYQRRAAYVGRVPAFSEQQVVAIYPFAAGDGTWGCFFKLNDQGRIRLETMSSESNGRALVVFIGTKGGQHQVVDMIIDRPVSDGVISVPRGLTDLEVAVLRKEFKVLGAEKEKKSKEPEKKDDVTDWTIDRNRGERNSKPVPTPPPQAKRRGSPEPDLPRLAD